MSSNMLFVAELRRVLAASGCPLCRFEREDDTRYLKSLLHEGLASAGMLERLSRAEGFCREHAWALQSMEERIWHDGLTNASFERVLLAEALASLEELPASRRGLSRMRQAKPIAQCPACASRARMRQIRAARLADALLDESTTHLFMARQQGLCMPHFRLVWVEEMPDGARGLLRNLQRNQLRRLLGHVDGYIRKHHWDVAEAQLPEEEASWRDAVALLAGDAPKR